MASNPYPEAVGPSNNATYPPPEVSNLPSDANAYSMYGAPPGGNPNTRDDYSKPQGVQGGGKPYTPPFQAIAQAARPPPGSITGEQAWNDEVRRGFVRKVLGIVFIQLLFTTAVALTFFNVDQIKSYVLDNRWLLWVAFGVSFALIITMSCSQKVRRTFPYNVIFLCLFTAAFSVMVGIITAQYDVREIGIALAVTCATVLGAFCVAAFTKLDLTKAGGFLTAVLFGVIAMSVIGIFWRNKWWAFAISIIAAVLFTAYLIYDLQLLMGGRANSLSPDEWLFASISIYLDIVQIFLNVLRIVGFISDM